MHINYYLKNIKEKCYLGDIGIGRMIELEYAM
jgi:hypothetical protein